MKVSYKVTFKDTSLAGKNVKNVATATSDNTKPGKSTKTVKVTKATPKKSTPKKSSGKSVETAEAMAHQRLLRQAISFLWY